MSVQSWHFPPNQLIQDEVAQVILRHITEPERYEALVYDEGHENIKGKFLVLEVAQQTRSHVIHPLAVADLRQYKSDGLQHIK